MAMNELNDHLDERVTIYLAIESTDLKPSALTDRLGACPDREWVIGAPRGKTGKRWECHGWVVETTVRSEEVGGQSASKLIPVAMERFERRVGPFAKAISELDSAQKYVVLTILAEHIPGIECSHSFLDLVSTIGGTFQIDL